MISPDNGNTWHEYGELIQGESFESGNYRIPWNHFLDPDNGLLISLYSKSRRKKEGNASEGSYDDKIFTAYYQISRDEGKTWDEPKQIIHGEEVPRDRGLAHPAD